MIDIDVTNIIDDSFKTLKEQIVERKSRLELIEAGTVLSIGEGIALVGGLPNVQSEELLRFSGGVMGMAYNLDEKVVGVILLDKGNEIEAGEDVYRTEQVLSIPVGEQLLGRVVDPLGRPLDDKGPIGSETQLPIEHGAPPIMKRAPVEVPLQTGIKTIDALIPIGRGQRELILGDRQTGKTAIALDTIINQKDTEVICIYCTIGKQKAATATVIDDLEEHGALEYTIVVSASGDTPAGIQYIAPYAAASMGEYFMEKGRDVFIVFDDLTWHARAYRELALLLRRPPGREAYPGDIFYIHARLLERATHLKDEYGGGSLTAFPIIETQGQNISAFIPTNLISITDGQIYLSPQLFQKDIRPAVDIGSSVSRVGGRAQLPAYRAISKKVKLAYTQFEELEGFARFGARMDEETRKTIERGRRIREILKQSQYDPLPVTQQIIQLTAATTGLLDTLDLLQIKQFKRKIRDLPDEKLDHIQKKIDGGEVLDEDSLKEIQDWINTTIANLTDEEKEE